MAQAIMWELWIAVMAVPYIRLRETPGMPSNRIPMQSILRLSWDMGWWHIRKYKDGAVAKVDELMVLQHPRLFCV